jgi:NADH dehydrogenase
MYIMKNIIIAGAGFAGISAAKVLSRSPGGSAECQITVFDKNEYTTMLPTLPDVAGSKIDTGMARGYTCGLLPHGTAFVNEEVNKIDFNAQSVSTQLKDYKYDYLLLSAGSVTDFYGFEMNRPKIYTLASLKDASKIKQDFAAYLNAAKSPVVVISGAGFTGLETASALREYAQALSKDVNIVLIEKSGRILGNMPEKMSSYTESFIAGLGLNVIRNSSINSFNGGDVELSTGEVFKDAFFIWTAGSRRSIENISGSFTPLSDGRTIVNEYLQLPEYNNVFAAGDCAAIKDGNKYLRKAVNFALYSGRAAGENIARALKNRALKKFKPVDLGWVIPLYPSSIGNIMGINIKGKLGLRLHYLM